MKRAITVFLVIWCQFTVSAATAGIVVDTDTENLLLGSWEATGEFPYSVRSLGAFAPLLPVDGGGLLALERTPVPEPGITTLLFGAVRTVVPADPFTDPFIEAPVANILDTGGFPGVEVLLNDIFGSYSFNATGTEVFFEFTNIRDTGGVAGTFSGDYCFATNRNDCDTSTAAVPGPTTLALIVLGLISLRKRRGA